MSNTNLSVNSDTAIYMILLVVVALFTFNVVHLQVVDVAYSFDASTASLYNAVHTDKEAQGMALEAKNTDVGSDVDSEFQEIDAEISGLK